MARIFRSFPGMECCDLKRDRVTGQSKVRTITAVRLWDTLMSIEVYCFGTAHSVAIALARCTSVSTHKQSEHSCYK